MSQLGALLENPLAAVVVVFLAGLATSLGPCTFARVIAFMGFAGAQENISKTRGLFLAFVLLVGLTVSYSSLGLVGWLANNLLQVGDGLYYATGIVMVLMGVHFAGLVRVRIPISTRLRKLKQRYSNYHGPGGSFALGATFGLMVCPCCLPGLLTIFAFTFAQGDPAYGIFLLFIYTLGHGIPLLAVGIFSGAINTITAIQRCKDHVNLATGTIMIIAGLLFLWLV